jgi:hypothetical protein
MTTRKILGCEDTNYTHVYLMPQFLIKETVF